MNPWLDDMTKALAGRAGVEPPSLTGDEARQILDIARIASHTSGERINAPLLTYLIGRMIERAPSTTLESLKELVSRQDHDATEPG